MVAAAMSYIIGGELLEKGRVFGKGFMQQLGVLGLGLNFDFEDEDGHGGGVVVGDKEDGVSQGLFTQWLLMISDLFTQGLFTSLSLPTADALFS
ncbi:hypothetical protein Tco_0920351 [Tanacetum coccineum]